MPLALVTGANTGIGKVTAEELAKRGYDVILAARNEAKTREVADAIGARAKVEKLDLGSLASVRACAERLNARGEPLDLLVANAGVAGQRGETADGFELHFGTNHLGHYLLTRLLLPRLEAATHARVVMVSSRAHYRPKKGIDWEAVRKPTQTVSGLPEYGVSKLANVLFAKELAKRAKPTVHTYALHPGVVASDAWRRVPWGIRHLIKLFMITNEEGAKTTLWCSTSDDVKDQTGLYYDACREKRPSKLASDEALARELWERSAEWTGLSP